MANRLKQIEIDLKNAEIQGHSVPSDLLSEKKVIEIQINEFNDWLGIEASGLESEAMTNKQKRSNLSDSSVDAGDPAAEVFKGFSNKDFKKCVRRLQHHK